MSLDIEPPPLVLLLAEFATPEALLAAAARTRDQGYRATDAFTPFPVEGLTESLGLRPSLVPLITLLAGILGGATGFFMCWFANVIHYPWNIGGRPHNSWPAWIPITFELTVLFAAGAAAFSMILLNKLPRLHHPLFDLVRFERVNRDRFFLCIHATDLQFDPLATRQFLESLSPVSVVAVPPEVGP